MVGGRRSALLQASAEPRRELQSSSPAKMRRRNVIEDRRNPEHFNLEASGLVNHADSPAPALARYGWPGWDGRAPLDS
eukprot:scaffold294_cov281-Pinguiococcus_pyrenoidosus.AAC.5